MAAMAVRYKDKVVVINVERKRRYTNAEIAAKIQYGLAYWARHYSVSVVAIWKIVHKKSYTWVED